MENKIESIFKHLGNFKNFPAYQLERRIDIFITIYLEEALNRHFNTNDFVFVFPEFPLHALKLKNGSDNWENIIISDIEEIKAYRSTRIDYVCWSKELKKVILIELKTDNNSFDYKQFWYYKYYSEKHTWNDLIKYYKDVSKKSEQEEKYDNGLKHIEKNTNGINPNTKIDFLYIAPSTIRERVLLEKHLLALNDFISFLPKNDKLVQYLKLMFEDLSIQNQSPKDTSTQHNITYEIPITSIKENKVAINTNSIQMKNDEKKLCERIIYRIKKINNSGTQKRIVYCLEEIQKEYSKTKNNRLTDEKIYTSLPFNDGSGNSKRHLNSHIGGKLNDYAPLNEILICTKKLNVFYYEIPVGLMDIAECVIKTWNG